MSLHKNEKRMVQDIKVGDMIVHESDQLRAVLEVGVRSRNGKLGVRLSGQGWHVIYWNPEYEVRVLLKNE